MNFLHLYKDSRLYSSRYTDLKTTFKVISTIEVDFFERFIAHP